MEGTKIDARKYLEQAYRLDQRINSKLTQLSLLRGNALNITGKLNEVKVQAPRDNMKMENTILKIIQKERELDDEIDRLIDLKSEVMEVIGKVPDIDCRLLLELRYLCFRSWEEIATEMDYSVDYVFKMHRKALEMVKVPG